TFVVLDPRRMISALRAILIQIGSLFGNPLDSGYLVLAIAVACLLALCFWRPNRSTRSTQGWMPAYLILALVGMIYVLSLRHPPILWYWLERSGYYYVNSALIAYLALVIFLQQRGV